MIDISCECFQAAQVGQSGILGDPIAPLLTYKFNYIDAADRKKYIHDCLQNIRSNGLTSKQVIQLKSLVADAIRPLSAAARLEMNPIFQNDVRNSSLLRRSIELTLRRQSLKVDKPFTVEMHFGSNETLQVETDLPQRAGIDVGRAHKVIETSLMGIHGLSQAIVEMKDYRALSGFREEEVPLLKHKLDFFYETISSQSKETNFHRVTEISGLPKFSDADIKINIDKFLKIRNSSEAREFRDWLGQIGEATDEEIAERVRSLRALAGLKVGGSVGKTLRFLITTGLGVALPNPVAGAAVGALDQILDKALPRSGIVAFVNELYPSIFEPRR